MEIEVYNTNFEKIKILENFKSVIWTDRFDTYGDFEIYFPMNKELSDIIKTDYYIFIGESEHTMIIENIAIDSDTEEGNFMVVTGRSLESILERRIVWETVTYKGSVQDAVESMMNDAFISPKIPGRKIPKFIFKKSTDPRIVALTFEAQYTGVDYLEIIQNLCTEFNMGYKIILDDNFNFVFSLYMGEDRSYNQTKNPYVVFSPEFENIINSNYYTSKEHYKNVTLVLGEGEGADAKSLVLGEASGIVRREIVTDARDISSTDNPDYMNQLRARGQDTLKENSVYTAFDSEVDTFKMFVYARDFFIGDIVQIENEYGNEGKVFISELIISSNEEGYSIYPTFKTITEDGDI